MAAKDGIAHCGRSLISMIALLLLVLVTVNVANVVNISLNALTEVILVKCFVNRIVVIYQPFRWIKYKLSVTKQDLKAPILHVYANKKANNAATNT